MRRKSDISFFFSVTNKYFEKLRGAYPHDFFMWIWKKKLLRLKNKLYKKQNVYIYI